MIEEEVDAEQQEDRGLNSQLCGKVKAELFLERREGSEDIGQEISFARGNLTCVCEGQPHQAIDATAPL